jgi:receptor protein-tyrosine kinase
MSLIEQAARRLEELKRAGIEISTEMVDQRYGAVAPASQHPATAGVPDAPVPAPAASNVPKRVSQSIEVDLERLEGMGYLVPDSARTQLTGELRVIKRPLLNNVRGKSAAPVEHANLIMVTSALPGEGKTFMAINLALSIATELDTHVLLVEADSSRPATMTRLGLEQRKGLLDVLTDPQVQMSDVLLRTNIDKLTLLPVGSVTAQASELLSSNSMQKLLDEVAGRYPDRIVVFDAPPLLPTPEARAFAPYMGQIVVVVEAGKTAQAAVVQALEMVEKCPVVMTILNKAPASSTGSNFTYYAY